MNWTVENIARYFDASTIDVENYHPERVRTLSTSAERVSTNCLRVLLILTHLLSAGSFAVAASFSSEFLLLTRFWPGLLLGLGIYGLILIGTWS